MTRLRNALALGGVTMSFAPAGNNALYAVVLTRLRLDERTRRYAARRATEGLSRREIIRCLQRYVARDLHQVRVSLLPSSSS